MMRRNGLKRRTVLAGIAALIPKVALSRVFGYGVPPVTGSAVTSFDFNNPASAITTAAPLTFGQVFRMSDVPSGTFPALTDASNNPLIYQIDQISPAWPDGSMRHCVMSALVPPVAGSANARVKISTTGSYSPSTPRSTADFTAHNFLVHYKNVVTNPTPLGGSNPSWAMGWTNKATQNGTGGSGNFTFSLNSAISAGRYQVIKNGPVCLEIYAYGPMVDDGNSTADAELFVEYWATSYSDPSNSANVFYFKHMAKISQPLTNPTSGLHHVVLGDASLYNGATKLRDLSDDTVTLGPSDVSPSASFVAPTAYFGTGFMGRTIMSSTWYQVTVQAGSVLPTGMTNGMYVMTDMFFSYQFNPSQSGGPGGLILFTRNNLQNGSSDPYSVKPSDVGLQGGTTAGHNSMLLTPVAACGYYNGFYITASANGDPILSPGTWASPSQFLPNLDGTTHDTSPASQKAYWQASGIIPPWDITISASCVSMDSAFWTSETGPLYFPYTIGPMRHEIDAGGDDWDTDGPWAEWDARWFMRFGATNWSATDHRPSLTSALCNAHLPQGEMLRQGGSGPPRIIPWDNGANQAGSSYPSLGAPAPNDSWYQTSVVNSTSGFVLPVEYNISPPPGGNSWAYGPWGRFSNYHWPSEGIIPYLFFGENYLIQGVRRSANRSLLQTFGGGSQRNYTSDPPYNFYGVVDAVASPYSEVMVLHAAGACLGLGSDPEVVYFANCMNAMWGFRNYLWGTGRGGTSMIDSRLVAFGWAATGGTFNNSAGFNWIYEVFATCWCRAITRATNSRVSADLNATYESGWWDEIGTTGKGTWGVGIYYGGGGAYRRGLGRWNFNNLATANPLTAYGMSNTAIGDDHLTLNADGTINYSTSGLQYGPGPANGDVFFAVSGANNWVGAGTTYDGIAEFGPSATPTPFPEGTPFYLCQLNTSALTFRLTPTASDPTGVNAITSVAGAPYRVDQDYFCYRPSQDQAGNYLLNGNSGISNNNNGLLRRAALAELVRTGAVPHSTYSPSLTQAYAVANGRTNPVNTFTTDNQGSTAGARLSQVTTIPIFPTLS